MRPPYGKAPYGEASYEKAPYELQESLRETTGRDFTRVGREFPLVCRRPKKVVVPRVVPFLDLLPFKGPFPLTGGLLRGGCLQEGPLRAGFLREGP